MDVVITGVDGKTRMMNYMLRHRTVNILGRKKKAQKKNARPHACAEYADNNLWSNTHFRAAAKRRPPLPPPRLISRCVACPQQAECQLHLKFDPHLLEVVRFGDLRAITAARVAFEAQVQLSTSVS